MKSTGRKDVNYKDIWGFFFVIDPIYLLRTRIVTQSLPTIWGRWWFWTGIKILTLGINRTNLMRTKVFCGFISKLAFEVENQAAPCTNACIIWGVKKFINSTTFCTFWIFQIFVATYDLIRKQTIDKLRICQMCEQSYLQWALFLSEKDL